MESCWLVVTVSVVGWSLTLLSPSLCIYHQLTSCIFVSYFPHLYISYALVGLASHLPVVVKERRWIALTVGGTPMPTGGVQVGKEGATI